MDPSQLFFLHVEVPPHPSYGLPMQHTEGGEVRATQSAAVPSAFDAARRTELQLGGQHDFLLANPNVRISRSENNLTRVQWSTMCSVVCIVPRYYLTFI